GHRIRVRLPIRQPGGFFARFIGWRGSFSTSEPRDPVPAAAWTKPSQFRLSNDKTWLLSRNETSAQRISRSAKAQKERYDVRLQSRARGKPSGQSWRPAGVDRFQQFHYTRICRRRKPAVRHLPRDRNGA